MSIAIFTLLGFAFMSSFHSPLGNRTSLYYVPKAMNYNDLGILRKLDELHLEHPTMGSRMLRDQLNRQGIEIGRLHTKTLMNIAQIHTILRQKSTSEKHPAHKIYPYLLWKLILWLTP